MNLERLLCLVHEIPEWWYLIVAVAWVALFWIADILPCSLGVATRGVVYGIPILGVGLFLSKSAIRQIGNQENHDSLGELAIQIGFLPILLWIVISFLLILLISTLWGLLDGRITVEEKRFRRALENGPSLADSHYLESNPSDGTPPYSISFVEYDARGDYWVPQQHTNAHKKASELATADKPLRLIIYCHGWQNGAQSEDVVRFAFFLKQLAKADPGTRVHGIYLAWCGNVYRPEFKPSEAYAEVCKDFGQPIVRNPDREHPRALWRGQVLATYHGRKLCAETDVCGVPMARTIFEIAETVKVGRSSGAPVGPSQKQSDVFVIGHSFGALMLERSLGLACVSGVARASKDPGGVMRPFPFDLILFVNSAAPSLYAKLLKDFLASHREEVVRKGNAKPAPLVVSLTSRTDCATGIAHPIGNMLAHWSGNLKRKYEKSDPPQATHYKRTPGHNPWLLDYEVTLMTPGNPKKVEVSSSPAKVSIKTRLARFFCDAFSRVGTPFEGAVPMTLVSLTDPVEKFAAKQFGDYRDNPKSSYWIVRCDNSLMDGHGDIWSSRALSLYSAFFGLSSTRARTDSVQESISDSF